MSKCEQMPWKEFRAVMKENNRAVKQARQKDNVALLQSHGIAYEVKNDGIHYIIRARGRIFDFWPTTGKWRERDNRTREGSFGVHLPSLKSGHGFASLLKELRV